MTAAGELSAGELDALVRAALAEDLGQHGDVTTKLVVRIDQPGRAEIVAKQAGVLAGVPVAEAVFAAVDKTLEVDWLAADGDALAPGVPVARITGRARAILAGERVALNFLQHLSGVATATAQYVSVCSRYGVQLLCTRKTLPGLRALQRYAVAAGGGTLHRAGLFDAILIKTNHVRLAGGLSEAIRRAKAGAMPVEAEVTSLAELEEAIAAGADKILLDNADLVILEQAVERTRGVAFLEVSGGVSLDNVEEIAKRRPDAISVGRITHSVEAIDLALRLTGPAGAAPVAGSR